jgi:hypothetical protein
VHDHGGSREVALDLVGSRRRLGHYAWIERWLFSTLGSWAVSVPEPAVKLHLGSHCAHHAWHARLWQERLPSLSDAAPEELIAPPDDGFVAFVAALAEPRAPEMTIEKLVGAYRVLVPHLVATYSRHLDETSRDLDGPTVRALTLILRDEEEDVAGGEALLAALVETPQQAARAADHRAHLEALLARAGGIAG